MGCECAKGDGWVEELVFEVDFEDFFAIFFDGKVDEKAARKAAERCFIEVERAVGGYHDERGHVIHTVPFAQELVDEFSVAGAVAGSTTRAENGVGFVDEDDAGCEFLRQAEDGPNVFLALANIHIVHIYAPLIVSSNSMSQSAYQIR